MEQNYQGLSHAKWDCKYQIVYVPNGRRKELSRHIRQQLGPVFRELARQKAWVKFAQRYRYSHRISANYSWVKDFWLLCDSQICSPKSGKLEGKNIALSSAFITSYKTAMRVYVLLCKFNRCSWCESLCRLCGNSTSQQPTCRHPRGRARCRLGDACRLCLSSSARDIESG